ncbi:glycosyltransferase family 2 protein [Salegentibacter sediminis]|uniref:glycosyltransferase family 2 protein n=1 Tax=Salegentibacter sediminis TaxID=1930251 RepID=UPI0009C12981|nr:glycosyltransferase family 2 protein [Salegentibacter sediminis]
MLLIIHQHAARLVRVHYKGEDLKVKETDLCRIFWDLAEQYPEELICWCEESYVDEFNKSLLKEIFPHDLIMASYALEHSYFPEQIGYIDQHPAINVNPEVRYGTWRMSTDVGGIKGKTLLYFRDSFGKIKDIGFLLNSIAKSGQHNGLFCYSEPGFFKTSLVKQYIPQPVAGISELFSFVYMHYKTGRVWLLLWCFIKFERSLPILSLLRLFFRKKYFLKEIDLRNLEKKRVNKLPKSISIDVIIPTLGRREYLLRVLDDLKKQSLLPKKVVVVEQNPDPKSQTELPELSSKAWPFEIVHHFIHKTGACTARNMALEEVDADWVFFADDDIRLTSNLLQSSLEELNRLGINCLNLNAYQTGEKQFFHKIKQWGSFGSGVSIVNSKFTKDLRFEEVFEYGFGEDQEYGMQLRNAGCDIIYHPDLKILHLKAPRGGFRDISLPPWKNDGPKPSPTIMLFAQKYFSAYQLKGFKTELFFRNYDFGKTLNPIKYWRNMQLRWNKSKNWAKKLSLK